jgi:nucleotidyltransferase/DNA polymerase involved in DNA repair
LAQGIRSAEIKKKKMWKKLIVEENFRENLNIFFKLRKRLWRKFKVMVVMKLRLRTKNGRKVFAIFNDRSKSQGYHSTVAPLIF